MKVQCELCFSMNMYAEALANPIKYQQNILEERARVSVEYRYVLEPLSGSLSVELKEK